MQELEKILEEINEEIKSSIAFSSVFTDGLCRARNIIINHLSRESTPEITRSSRDTDGWIPVEERLPEDGQEVLCCDDMAVYLVEYQADWDAPFSDLDGIIAWSPIPEPYRPERSSDEKE